LIIEAIPKDETDAARRYRGYIAIDEVFTLKPNVSKKLDRFILKKITLLRQWFSTEVPWKALGASLFDAHSHVNYSIGVFFN
jgi:hypothetical protein